MTDIVERLRSTPNWQRQDFKDWKDGCNVYDRAPLEAAFEIERLRNFVTSLVEHPISHDDLYALVNENERMRTALQSIAANTCCDKCQEAALVARAALTEQTQK